MQDWKKVALIMFSQGGLNVSFVFLFIASGKLIYLIKHTQPRNFICRRHDHHHSFDGLS